MVKKLYKYEFISLLRWVLPIDAFCLIMSLLLRVAIEVAKANDESLLVLMSTVLIGITFLLSIIVMSSVTFWLVVVRFYKHLLSSEGYLTFSIPVTATTHLVCKLVCGSVVTLFSSIVTLIGIILAVSGLIPSDVLSEFFMIMGPDGHFWSTEIVVHLIIMLITVVFSMIISSVYGLILPYTSMCIGQLSRKNKLAMSVLWYFVISTVISVVMEIISMVSVFVTSTFFMNSSAAIDSTASLLIDTIDMYSFMFGSSALTSLAFGIAGFLVCKYILSNKLNLE